jgi:hypothetical protein
MVCPHFFDRVPKLHFSGFKRQMRRDSAARNSRHSAVLRFQCLQIHKQLPPLPVVVRANHNVDSPPNRECPMVGVAPAHLPMPISNLGNITLFMTAHKAIEDVCFQLGMLWGELVPEAQDARAADWYERAIEYLPGLRKGARASGGDLSALRTGA